MSRIPLATLSRSSPPPPPFNNSRQMLPPTSPPYMQTHYNGQASTSRSHPPPTTFARDLSTPASTHRPGSSMSISSMLGSDPERPSHDPTSANRARMYASAPPTSITPLSRHSTPPSLSPRLVRGTGPQNEALSRSDEFNTWRNDKSSHLHSNPPEGIRRETTRASTGAPSYTGNALDLQNQNSRPTPSTHASMDQSGYQESQAQYVSLARAEQSNPAKQFIHDTTSIDPQGNIKLRSAPQDALPRNSRGSEDPMRADLILGGDLQRAYEASHLKRGERLGSWNTDRPAPAIPLQQSFDTKQEQPVVGGVTNYPFLSRVHDQIVAPDRRNRTNIKTLSDQSPEPGPHAISGLTKSMTTTEALQHSRDLSHPGSNMGPQDLGEFSKHTTSRFPESLDHRRFRESPKSIPRVNGRSTSHPDQHLGVMDEGLDQPKSSLGLLTDNNKRWGRISPLPQAVQGAQIQRRGPASEPGIKNEFARMFSGIGSGVGSGIPTPVPNETGASMSFPSSPTRLEEHERRTPFSGRGELLELMKPRASSRGGRRSKKIKDEEIKADLVVCDILADPRPVSTRGTKRSRHGHHHHSHAHQ